MREIFFVKFKMKKRLIHYYSQYNSQIWSFHGVKWMERVKVQCDFSLVQVQPLSGIWKENGIFEHKRVFNWKKQDKSPKNVASMFLANFVMIQFSQVFYCNFLDFLTTIHPMLRRSEWNLQTFFIILLSISWKGILH